MRFEKEDIRNLLIVCLVLLLLLWLRLGLKNYEKTGIINGSTIFKYNKENVNLVNNAIQKERESSEKADDKKSKDTEIVGRVAFLENKDGHKIILLDKKEKVKFYKTWERELGKGTFLLMGDVNPEIILPEDISRYSLSRYQVLRRSDLKEIRFNNVSEVDESFVRRIDEVYCSSDGLHVFKIQENERAAYWQAVDEKLDEKIGFKIEIDLGIRFGIGTIKGKILYLPEYTLDSNFNDNFSDWKGRNTGFNKNGHIQLLREQNFNGFLRDEDFPYDTFYSAGIDYIYEETGIPDLNKMNSEWKVLGIEEVTWRDVCDTQYLMTVDNLKKLANNELPIKDAEEKFYFDLYQFAIQTLQENGKIKEK